MPTVGGGGAVEFQVFGYLGNALPAHAGDQGEAQFPDDVESFRRVGGDANGRVGLLVGARRNHHVVHIIVMAVVVKAVIVPGFEDDFQGFGETLPAFVIRHIVALIGTGKAAAADAEVQAALGNVVHRGGFLGQADGMGQGQHADAGADAHPLGAGGDDAGHQKGN